MAVFGYAVMLFGVVILNFDIHCHFCGQVLGENQALVDFKRQVVVLKKNQDAEFVARQKEALAVRVSILCPSMVLQFVRGSQQPTKQP